MVQFTRMGLNKIILVTEDLLSAAVSTKILAYFGINIVQSVIYEGQTYLQRKAQSFNQTAHEECGVFMLTDLDSPNLCPPTLIESWLRAPRNPRFLLRVAVMEVESWIMADRHAFANFLSVPVHRVPRNTDELLNPKEFLISLVLRSKKRRLREELVATRITRNPHPGDKYNEHLSTFVKNQWDLERAAAGSQSLERTVARLRQESEGRLTT